MDNSVVLASDPSSLAASRPRSVATATALRGSLPSTRLARDHRSTCPFAGPYGGVGGGAGAGVVIPALALGGAVLLGPVGGVAGGLLGATLSFFGTRALFLVAARRRQQQVQRTFDVLVNEVRSVARPVERAAESLAEARARQGIADAPRASLVEDQAAVGVTAEAAVTRVR